MRRISLALALVGAVAAAGCGVQSKAPPTGQNKGVQNNLYSMEVVGDQLYAAGGYTMPVGGYISGSGLDCGYADGVYHPVCKVSVPYGTQITLTANPATGYAAVMFAGAAAGNLFSYQVTMSSDKFVAVRFAANAGALGAHPNFSKGSIHVDEYMRWAQNIQVPGSQPGALTCNSVSCHGAAGQGAGYAPACDKCHAMPALPPAFGHATPFAGTDALNATHGAAYVANGAATCGTCHGGTALTGGVGPACNTCHMLPHAADYASTATLQAQHGAAYVASYTSPAGAKCSDCHGATLGGAAAPLTALSCSTCHAAPHDATQAYGTHGQTTHPVDYAAEASLPAGSHSCFDCHQGLSSNPQAQTQSYVKGLAPGAPFAAPACFSCHTTFNHNSYTHPAAYEGEFYSGGRTGFVFGFVGSFDGVNPTYIATTIAGGPVAPLPWYGKYVDGAATWEPNCVGCHGGASNKLLGYENGAPSCKECHYMPPLPEVLTDSALNPRQGGNHFTADKEAFALYSFSQACERCHTSDGFKDYVGSLNAPAPVYPAVWAPPVNPNNDKLTFLIDAQGPAGTQGMTNGGYKPGPYTCATCHNPTTDPSRDALHGIHVQGLSNIYFPSFMTVTADKGRALCGTCHQARVATANLVSTTANKIAAAQGVTYTSITTNFDGGLLDSVNGVTSIAFSKLSTTAPVPQAPLAGFTAIFNGNATAALNGVRATVATYTIGSGASYVTFNTLLGAAASPKYVACVLPSGTTTTCKVNSDGSGGNVTAPGTGWAKTYDGVVFYPTATGGSNTSLADANRASGTGAWTANQWAGWYVFFQTGANAGKYALITDNTTTQLNFADAGAAVAAGDFYQIVKNDAATLDSTPKANASGTSPITANNPHYLGAAATEFGSEAAGWFQYPGKTYVGHAAHVDQRKTVLTPNDAAAATCADCHDAHSLEIVETACTGCHGGRTATAMQSFVPSWSTLSVDATVEAGKTALWTAISTYAKLTNPGPAGTVSVGKVLDGSGNVTYAGYTSTLDFYKNGVGICFDNLTNAYWFIASSGDLNPEADGYCYDVGRNQVPCCQTKTGFGAKVVATDTNGSTTNPLATGLSPRLLRATFIYKFAMKEPGAWAHNGKYVAQVIFDAIEDLNAGITALSGTTVAQPYTRP
jgi:hypothetical protein